MKKFYRINTKSETPYLNQIHFDITDNNIIVTDGEESFDISINNLLSRNDYTNFSRFYLIAKNILKNDGSRYLKFTGELFNLYQITRRTKQSADEYCKQNNTILPASIIIQPDAVDFSDVDISFYATPSDVVSASGAEIEIIELNANRNNKPKFKIKGLSTIEKDSKQSYEIGYINRASGEVSSDANFKIIINSNIGILNKREVNLVNGKTDLIVDSTGLNSGDTITLEVGSYSYSNTTQFTIDVV